jgi:hypothetical protein
MISFSFLPFIFQIFGSVEPLFLVLPFFAPAFTLREAGEVELVLIHQA